MPAPFADNYMANVGAGAQIGNMIALRQERAMQLRSQAAMNAVKERELQAQAEMFTQHASYYGALKQKEDEENAQMKIIAPTVRDQAKAFMATDPDLSEEDALAKAMTVAVAAYPTNEKLMRGYKDYMTARSQAKEQDFPPTAVNVPNPTPGKPPIPVLRTGPKTSQMLEAKEKPDEISDTLDKQRDAATKGDDELANFYKARLVKLTQSTGTTVKVNPDGTVELIQGPLAGPEALTKANQTKAQESQAQSLATIDTANRLEPLIDKETVGAQAFAESWVKDRILAQQFPELASQKRAKAEQLAASLRASAVKELRSDGNITEGERKQILQAVPTINDPVDSPTRAKQLVQSIRQMSAVRAMVAARRMGTPIPKAAAMAVDDETLADLFHQGLITQDQAKQAYQLKRQ